MASGFDLATAGDKKDFNDLNVEDKKVFIKEHGWFNNGSPSQDVVVHFKISHYINEKLESEHEYFERSVHQVPDVTQNLPANIPVAPVYIYYDNGVKIKTQEYPDESRVEETRNYSLYIDEPIEFSTHKYAPFKEKYRVVLKDVKYGDIFDL